MEVDLRHDGLDLCSPTSLLWLGVTTHKTGPIGKSVRIGLTHAADRLLRFYERGNAHISGPKRLLNVPVRWACRMGVCRTCESGLIDGRVSYTPEPLRRPAKGNVFICCSTPLTAIDLDL
jgi:hypothetical protein